MQRPSLSRPTMLRMPMRDAALAGMWLLVLVELALPSPGLARALSIALLVYVGLSLAGLRWQSLVLCGLLAAATLAACVVYGAWPGILRGAGKSLIFAAFMPTVLLVRATAEQRPEIAAARRLFLALEPRQRGGGLLFGAHVLGSVLSIGMFAVLAPVIGRDGGDGDRARMVGIALRSLCICSLWSPFFVGMGLATHHIPTVELWQIMPLGLSFALFGLFLSFLMFDRAGGLAGLWRTLRSLSPIAPSAATAALTVMAITGLSDLSTLEALVVGMPVLCLAALLAAGRRSLDTAIRATRSGLGNVRGEICILTLAVTLGAVLEAALGETGLAGRLSALQPSDAAVIAATIGIMALAGLAGIHPIVSLTVLLVLFGNVALPVHDLVLMQTALIGWAFGAMISVSGISVVTASALFGLAPERLIRGDNLLFVVVFGGLSAALLTGLNRLLTG